MQKVQNSKESVSIKEMHKTSYSHGLEKIYSLESVDISTIKSIKQDELQICKTENSLPEKFAWIFKNKSQQLLFKFESSFSKEIPPFVLREPIQMLELTKKVENHLLAINKNLIQDLIIGISSTVEGLTSLGQGHIDEIKQKLQEYLADLSLQPVTRLDFQSWLKTLTAGISLKKIAAVFSFYGLSVQTPLSSAEQWEWQHLSVEKRRERAEEGLIEFKSASKSIQIHADLQLIIDTFIKPWLELRFGMATEDQLLERLMLLSYSSNTTEKIFNWISIAYFEGKFPLSFFLCHLEGTLYANNGFAADAYKTIMDIALSYFFKPGLQYTLNSLIIWIARECAKKWLNFTLEHIERIIRLSPQLRVRKATCGTLIVRCCGFLRGREPLYYALQ